MALIKPSNSAMARVVAKSIAAERKAARKRNGPISLRNIKGGVAALIAMMGMAAPLAAQAQTAPGTTIAPITGVAPPVINTIPGPLTNGPVVIGGGGVNGPVTGLPINTGTGNVNGVGGAVTEYPAQCAPECTTIVDDFNPDAVNGILLGITLLASTGSPHPGSDNRQSNITDIRAGNAGPGEDNSRGDLNARDIRASAGIEDSLRTDWSSFTASDYRNFFADVNDPNSIVIDVTFNGQVDQRAALAATGAVLAVTTSGASTTGQIAQMGITGGLAGWQVDDAANSLLGLTLPHIQRNYEQAQPGEDGRLRIRPGQWRTISTVDGECTVAIIPMREGARPGVFIQCESEAAARHIALRNSYARQQFVLFPAIQGGGDALPLERMDIRMARLEDGSVRLIGADRNGLGFDISDARRFDAWMDLGQERDPIVSTDCRVVDQCAVTSFTWEYAGNTTAARLAFSRDAGNSTMTGLQLYRDGTNVPEGPAYTFNAAAPTLEAFISSIRASDGSDVYQELDEAHWRTFYHSRAFATAQHDASADRIDLNTAAIAGSTVDWEAEVARDVLAGSQIDGNGFVVRNNGNLADDLGVLTFAYTDTVTGESQTYRVQGHMEGTSPDVMTFIDPEDNTKTYTFTRQPDGSFTTTDAGDNVPCPEAVLEAAARFTGEPEVENRRVRRLVTSDVQDAPPVAEPVTVPLNIVHIPVDGAEPNCFTFKFTRADGTVMYLRTNLDDEGRYHVSTSTTIDGAYTGDTLVDASVKTTNADDTAAGNAQLRELSRAALAGIEGVTAQQALEAGRLIVGGGVGDADAANTGIKEYYAGNDDACPTGNCGTDGVTPAEPAAPVVTTPAPAGPVDNSIGAQFGRQVDGITTAASEATGLDKNTINGLGSIFTGLGVLGGIILGRKLHNHKRQKMVAEGKKATLLGNGLRLASVGGAIAAGGAVTQGILTLATAAGPVGWGALAVGGLIIGGAAILSSNYNSSTKYKLSGLPAGTSVNCQEEVRKMRLELLKSVTEKADGKYTELEQAAVRWKAANPEAFAAAEAKAAADLEAPAPAAPAPADPAAPAPAEPVAKLDLGVGIASNATLSDDTKRFALAYLAGDMPNAAAAMLAAPEGTRAKVEADAYRTLGSITWQHGNEGRMFRLNQGALRDLHKNKNDAQVIAKVAEPRIQEELQAALVRVRKNPNVTVPAAPAVA